MDITAHIVVSDAAQPRSGINAHSAQRKRVGCPCPVAK